MSEPCTEDPHGINFNSAVLRAVSKGGSSQTAYVATVQEKILPRLSLTQSESFSGGHATMGYGGQFLSNRITLGANYQTIFNPLVFGVAGRHIYQAWMINVAFTLPGGSRFHYDNFVDAFGRVRYTAFVSGLGYNRGTALEGVSARTGPVRLFENIVQGSVEDEKGRPVWGIAVRIGSDTVFSDNSGRFFVRTRDSGKYPLEVLLGRSVNPTRWDVVSAPGSATAQPMNKAVELKIVVRSHATLVRRPTSGGASAPESAKP